jgi:transposase
MSRKRRYFTPEFKAEAVALVLDRGLEISEVADDLDLHPSTLRRWVDRFEAETGEPGDSLSSSEREELKRLRKEVRVLREEKTILKKAAAFFAKESQ